MSEEVEVMDTQRVPEGECHSDDRCPSRERPNLCNDLVYTFGANTGCRAENEPLEGTGGTKIGYGINAGKLRDVKIVWSGSHPADEVIVVQKNGQDIAWVHIEGEEGVECAEVMERFCDCDVVNVVSKAAGVSGPEVGEWKPASCITVTLEIEPKCRVHFLPEGDGVAEAIDTTGSTAVVTGATWYTRTLDTERNNTLGGFATFIDSEDAYELGFGVYKIWYESGIEFDQSVNVAYNVKLQENVDGAGWIDIPQSGNVDFILAGDEGNVSAGRMITYKVPHGSTAKIRIQEKITQDTSIQNATGGSGIVVERVANGIATMHSLHANL